MANRGVRVQTLPIVADENSNESLIFRSVQALVPFVEGSDKKFIVSLSRTAMDAWGFGPTHRAWVLCNKYAAQLKSCGIRAELIPEPVGKQMPKELRCVDIRNGKVVMLTPYGDPANPNTYLNAYFNRDENAWIIHAAKYGAVLAHAERFNLLVSARARSLLSTVAPIDSSHVGSVTVRDGRILLKLHGKKEFLMDGIRTLPGRRYNPETQVWEIPLASIEYVRSLANEFDLRLADETKHLVGDPINPRVGTKVGVYSKDPKRKGMSPDLFFSIRYLFSPEKSRDIHAIPGAEWIPNAGLFAIPPESANDVEKFAATHNAEVSAEARLLFDEWGGVQSIIDASAADDAELHIAGFGDETFQLYPFQRAGVKYCLERLGFYDAGEGVWQKKHGGNGSGVFVGDEMGLGKAQVNGTRVLTPKGWTNIENLFIGDYVIGSNGHATRVTGVFPRGEMDIFTVGFNDGSILDVSGDHLWAVQSVQNGHRKPDEWQVYDTNYLASNLHDGASNAKWKIPLVQPVHFEAGEPLPIDPYVLGLLLGDGCIGGASVMFSSSDNFIVGELEKRIPNDLAVEGVGGYDYRIVSQHAGSPNTLRRELDKLGLRVSSGEKFIPETYLRTSPENRLALLRGLMDAGGHAGKDGTNEYVSISRELADGVTELVHSLGGVVRRSTTQPTKSTQQPTKNGESHGQLAYRVNVKTHRVNVKLMDCPFLLPRKVDSWVKPTKYPPNRNIESITPNGRGQVTCIAVDASDHLYVTEHYLVTHNTPQGLAILKATNSFPAVVVCPSIVKENWRREAVRWIPGIRVKVIDGTGKMVKSGQGEFIPASIPDADLYIVNFDIVSHWVEKFPTLNGIVVDESHYIKNGTAQRTKATIRLADKVRDTGVRVCLSGTMVENAPSELPTQLRVIGRLDDFGGAAGFRTTYKKSDHRSQLALNRKLRATCYVRRLKANVLTDLPPLTWDVIPVKGDPKIMAEYHKAENDIIKYLMEIVSTAVRESGADDEEAQEAAWRAALKARAAEHLVSLNHLRQLAARAKMHVATEWVHEFLSSNQKLVMFGWHTPIVEEIGNTFANGAMIIGGISDKQRNKYVDAFQQNQDQRVIACNIKAGGVGITLTAASTVLFLEQAWTPGAMDQAASRCHRNGQRDAVMAWVMMCEGTVDEDMAMLIAEKRGIVERTLDGSSTPYGVDIDEDALTTDIAGGVLINMVRRAQSQN